MNRVVEGGRLAGFGAAYFFASGAFMSYWPVWLKDRGITDAEIGTLFMSRQMVGVVSVLAIGLLAHRIGRLRGMLLALSVAGIVMMGAYELAHSFLLLLLIGLVWGCIWSPTMALYDGVLVNEARARGFVYGKLRIWASLAFISGTLLCGLSVDTWGPPAVLFVGWAGILCMVPLALALPPAASRVHDESHAPFGLRDLLRSRPFQLFMVATGLAQASHAVLYSFGTLTWRAAGHDDLTIGLLWGESVAAEILLLLASGWLIQHIGISRLIAIGLASGLVRWSALAFTTDLPALIVLQALHAGTFAACHLGAMGFLQRALPASGMALGQSVYYALGTGAMQAVVYQLAGLLYGWVGQLAFLFMALISTVGLAAMLLLMRRWKGELLVGGPG
ncbi:MAG TPA: MFS transporter [Reyranella sp.]|nr:MFS transporter [Reyranella sp.]